MSSFTFGARCAHAVVKATGRCLRAHRILWFSAALVLLASSRVTASEGESNLVLMPVQSFSGTTGSIPIPSDLAGGMMGVETGPITLSIDPDATNVFGLDNFLQQGKIDVTLQLSSPLFTTLGETPRVRIVESGPASVQFPNSDSLSAASNSVLGYDFLFQALLTGGGTVENGLFAGTVFQNVNAYDGQGSLGSWIVQPNSTVTWDIQNHGSVTFPDGTVVSGIGGSGSLTIAPEPSSLTLSGLGMAAIIALIRRVRRAKIRQ
jgi:hypothetical protein